jgi:hypothetical protein
MNTQGRQSWALVSLGLEWWWRCWDWRSHHTLAVDYAWFVGFAVSAGSYVVLMSGAHAAVISAEAVERGGN